jgi:hypothetical protein
MKWRVPSGDHSGWKMDSRSPPATWVGLARLPSAENSATHNSVPTQGMLGCRQLSQASLRPSGDSRGEE